MNRKKVIRRKDMERIRLEQVQCSCLRQGSRLPKTCGGQVGGQVGKVFGFGVLAALIFTPLDIRKMYVRFRNMARFYLTGLALLMAFAMGTAHAAAWASKKQITINATKVPSNQNNFPVLISITDTDLRDDAQDDGDDICFTTDPDETNPANRLSHEIEYFDGGTGQLVAWVKIPNLSGSSDTQFYMHYGNPTCSSQQDATNVWDSNYKGVWHLGDGDNTAPNFYQDSTPNNNDGTLIDANGNTAQDDGQVGKAMDFFGDADRLNVGSDPELDNLGPMTFSMWVFTNTVAAGPTYWWKNASDGLQQRDNSTIGFTYDTDDTSVRRVPPDGYISADTWMYISFTWDGTSSYTGINIYRDGTEAASYPTTAGSGTVSDDSANDLIIAGRTTDKYADGVIDEVRISDIARSADWITTCYNNQSNQTVASENFIKAVGSETDSSLPVELSAFTATAGDGKVTLKWVTESEVENLGFNIYRSTKYNDQLSIINDQLIPGAGNSSQRHDYEYVDKGLTNGVTYWYKLEDVDYSGNTELHGPVSATPMKRSAPREFRLYPNYPNPFNPATTISYDLPDDGLVELTVYNMRGEKVTTLMQGKQSAGSYKLNWDGTDRNGGIVSSGIYILRIASGSYSRTSKMVFIR